MSDHKLRIQFQKTGDLRWISHRDLARAFERLFRRVELPLAMSEGFHPHARINFPSALSLGIQGDEEWVEVMLSDEIEQAAMHQMLSEKAPPGLIIVTIDQLDRGVPKPVVEWMAYEIRVPAERQPAAQTAIDALRQQVAFPVSRANGKPPIDLLDTLKTLELTDGKLRFSLTATRTAQAKPRDVLAAVGLEDLEQRGQWLTRTEVHLQANN